MKKRIITAFLFVLICASASAQTQSYKRGLCVDNGKLTSDDLKQFTPGVSWYYNWGTSTATNYADANIIYVPMTWSGGYSKTDLKNFLQAHPDVEYLLAFNEPNFKDQANMTPSQAAAAWPALEAIADEFNLKLVSPAPNWCGWCVEENGTTYYDPYKYLEDFFAACPDCRVDYIGIHFYMGNLNGIKGSLEKLYNDFEKPIWLTEFNMDKNGMGDNGTADEQRAYMVDVLNYLEQTDYIYRYSWFLARGGIVSDLLTTTTGELSDLGKIYTHMSSYDDNFYHAVNTTIEAEHYISMENVSLVVSTDVSGNISVGYVDAGSMLEYNIDVPETGGYSLNLRTTSENASVVEYYSNDIKIDEFDIPATGSWTNWQTASRNINLNAGKQKLKFVFKSGGSDINWLSLTKDDVSGVKNAGEESVKIYPNPANDVLTVDSVWTLNSGVVYDMQGRKIMDMKPLANQSFDVSMLSPGLYMLQLHVAENAASMKPYIFSKN